VGVAGAGAGAARLGISSFSLGISSFSLGISSFLQAPAPAPRGWAYLRFHCAFTETDNLELLLAQHTVLLLLAAATGVPDVMLTLQGGLHHACTIGWSFDLINSGLQRCRTVFAGVSDRPAVAHTQTLTRLKVKYT
jgi:predicted Co/Zn/Cd cation transporter (cation efflux family)